MGKKKGKGKKGTNSTALNLGQFVGPRAVVNKATAHLPTAPRPKTEEELNRPSGFRGGGSSGSRGHYGGGGNDGGFGAGAEVSAADSAAKWRRGQPVGGGNDSGAGGYGFGGRGEQGEALGPSQADSSNDWRGGRSAAPMQQQQGGPGGPGGFSNLASNEADTAQQWRGGRAAQQQQQPMGSFGGPGPRAVEPDLPSGSWRRTQPAQPQQDSGAMFPGPSAAETTQNWRGNAAAQQAPNRFGGGGLGRVQGPIRGTASASLASASPEPAARSIDAQPWRRGGAASSGAGGSGGGLGNPSRGGSRFSSLMDPSGPSQSVRPKITLKSASSAAAATTQSPAAAATPSSAAAAAPGAAPGGASKWTPRGVAAAKPKPISAPSAAQSATATKSAPGVSAGWTPKNANVPKKRTDENRPPSGVQQQQQQQRPNTAAAAAATSKPAAGANRFGVSKFAAPSKAAPASSGPPQPGSWAPRNPNIRKPISTPSAAGGAKPTHQIVRPKVSSKPKPEPRRAGGGGLFGAGGARSDPRALKRSTGSAASGVSRLRPSVGTRTGAAGTRASLNPSRTTQDRLSKRQKESEKDLEEKKDARNKQSQFEAVLSKIDVNEDLVEKEVFESGIKSLNFEKTPTMRAPMITLAVRLVHEGKMNVKQLGKMFEAVFATISHELMLELLIEGKEKMGDKTLENKVRTQQKKKFDLHAALKIEEDADIDAWFDEKGLSCLKPKVDVASLLVKNSAKSPAELFDLIKQHTVSEPAEEEDEDGGSAAAPKPAVERSVAREASKIVFEKYFAGKCDASILDDSKDLLALVVANSNDNACEILLQAEKAWIGKVPDNKNAKPNLDKPAFGALFESLYRSDLATLNSMGAWRLVKPSKKKVYEGKAKLQALMATAAIIQKLEDEEEEERIRLEEEAIEAGEEIDEDIPGFERNQNYDD